MNEENIKSEDHINLPPFKKTAIQILRSTFSVIDLFAEVIRKSKLLLLAGLISGLAVGFSYYSSRPAYFEVSMIAESSAAYRKTLSEMIKSLNALIGTRSQEKLATELDISDQQSRQISLIEMTGLSNESLENDTSTKYNQPFKITARIHNPSLADTFQNAIEKYLDNKPSLKKIKDDQVRFYNEKLAYTDKELAKLDTLKTEYNHFLASSKITTTYYSNDVDPSTIYKQSNDLINEKGTIVYWLSTNSKPIQVIDEFKSPVLPQSYSLVKSLSFGALIGLGICFLLGLYLELYRKIRNYKGNI
ncbi:MAG TPA: hypothetical protein VFI33_14025 [Puia sp.]|nr:hypothetical protein [Puia sp.]